MATLDTKTRLLDAAEESLAAHGLAGTSLRGVADAAKVNVALVKYHFGSKDQLMETTLQRRLGPINRQRLLLLDALEAEYPAGALPLEGVLTALIGPAVKTGLSGGKEGTLFLRLFGRLFSEPATGMQLIRRQMGPMIKRFDAAFKRALPDLADSDLAWRKMATFGVVQHSLLMLSMMDELPVVMRIPLKLLKGVPGPEKTLAQLVAFSAAGMRAQVPSS